jgi:hypothetical protein
VRTARAAVIIFCSLVVVAAVMVPNAKAQRHLTADRAARPASEGKINARLMSEIKIRRGDARARGMRPGSTGVHIDRHGRAYVDVRAQVTAPLQKKIAALGGRVVSTSARYDSIVAWMPLLTLERLATDDTVRAIEPAQ